MEDYKWKLEVKYSPDQPRVPEGQPGGGQFASGTGWGSAKEVGAEEFHDRLWENVSEGYEAFVTDYSPDEYREMGAVTVLLGDGQSGYALKPDGDVISVFSGNRRGNVAMKDAVARGGTKLDCYAGKLPGFYAKHGFKEYDRWPWDDQYAPKGWNYERDGRPDVVFMRLEGR